MIAPRSGAEAGMSAVAKSATGIRGLDAVTGGGLPTGRATLVSGTAGSGKTLLGLHFLVAGARDLGEPGLLITFEESADNIRANVASLGFDLEYLEGAGLLTVSSLAAIDADSVQSGEFSLEPLFLIVADAVARRGVRRVCLDTVESLLLRVGDTTIVRRELVRLVRWLADQGLTTVITGERSEGVGSRVGYEEFVTDCVILLEHDLRDGVATRKLRVAKYRGSSHGTNQYPFLIGPRGLALVPITEVVLDYPASTERVSSGVTRLDHMLGGGYFRGVTALVTGEPGTGKSTLGAHFVDAAARRGERCLLVLFEESTDAVLRNMSSVGLDLGGWVDSGLLRIWATRPTSTGIEELLFMLAEEVDEQHARVVVLDGIGVLAAASSSSDASRALARVFDLLKTRGVTTLATSILRSGDDGSVGISSLVDTWVVLRMLEWNGERNRTLQVLKSRGTSHSNQVREFLITDTGAQLVDVYLGRSGVLTGSARIVQMAEEAENRRLAAIEADRLRREVARRIEEARVRLRSAQDDLMELEQTQQALLSREADLQTTTDDVAAALSDSRWSDPSAASLEELADEL